MKNIIDFGTEFRTLKKSLFLLLVAFGTFIYSTTLFPSIGNYLIYNIDHYLGFFNIIIGLSILILALSLIFKREWYGLHIVNFIFIGLYFSQIVGINSNLDYVSKKYPLLIEYNQNNLDKYDLNYDNISNILSYTDKKNIDKYQNFINISCKRGEYNRSKELNKYQCEKISPHYSKIKFSGSEKEYIMNNSVFLITDEFHKEYGNDLKRKELFVSLIKKQ